MTQTSKQTNIQTYKHTNEASALSHITHLINKQELIKEKVRRIEIKTNVSSRRRKKKRKTSTLTVAKLRKFKFTGLFVDDYDDDDDENEILERNSGFVESYITLNST